MGIQVFLLCIFGIVPIVMVDSAKYVPKWKKQACEIPASRNPHSHYICDDDGEVKCLPGWNGDLCDVPKCRPGCDPLQGYCNRPGECLCKLGYYGEKCNKCIPLPGCQHGYCNVSFECICHEGWDGLFCSEPTCRSDCHQTRGYCDNPGECKCRLGWAGKTCRECQILPGCLNGFCEKPLECKCHEGYTGILCQTPICSKTCHKERGYCKKPGECRCRVGWWGKDCDTCYPYPGCVNGNCTRPWECNCLPGWGGMLCDEELNFCEDNPKICENDGKCLSLGKNQYECLCPVGTSGKNCEEKKVISTTEKIVVTEEISTIPNTGVEDIPLVEDEKNNVA
nr:delta-like protein C [Onthophagus taurus]